MPGFGLGLGLGVGRRAAAPSAPLNTVAPSVTTTGKIGSAVTGSAGTWTGATSFAYRHQFYDALNDLWIDMPGETTINVAALDAAYDRTQGRLAVTATGPGGSVTAYSSAYDITQPVAVITNDGSIGSGYKIGDTIVHSSAAFTGAGSIFREWRAAGVAIPGQTGASLVTTEAMGLDGKVLSLYWGVINSGGTDDTTITGATMVFHAPTSAGNLSAATFTEGQAASTLDFAGQVSVVGDADLSSGTWSVQSGAVPTGMTRIGGLVFGTPSAPQAAATLTLRYTNSGGSVDVSCLITVNERALGANLIVNGDFPTDTSGWTAANSATLSVASAALRVTTTGTNNAQARQNVTISTAGTYRVKVKLVGGTSSGTPSYRLGSAAGGTQYGNITSSSAQLPDGRHYVDVVLPAGTLFTSPNVPSTTNGQYYDFDDIEVLPHSAATVPAAMVLGEWSAGDAGSVLGKDVTVTISTAPSNGGSAITSYVYRVNGGPWTQFSPALTATGTRTVTLPAFETAHNIEVAAVNANGTAGPSDAKPVTPHFASNVRFVSTTGNDTTGTGLYAAPWRTTAKAASTMTAGQVGYVRPGTYGACSFSSSGTSGQYIKLTTLPGEEHQAILTGSGAGSQIASGVNAVGKSYLWIEGLSIQSISGSGIGIFGVSGSVCGHIVINNNKINTTTNAGIYIGGNGAMTPANTVPNDTWPLVDITITNNDVTATNAPSGTNECISLGNGTDTFIISGNTVHDSDQYGIDCKLGARNGAIYDNTVWNMEKHGIYLDSACRTLENIDVYDNLVYDCGSNGLTIAREDARGTADPSYGSYQNVRNINVYRNLFSGNARGILIYKHSGDIQLTVVHYDGATTTDFDLNETLTGANGATGRIVGHIPLTSTTGTLYVIKGNATAYSNNNAITAPGASALVNGTPALEFVGDFDDITVAHNTFADSVTEDVECNSAIASVIENFKFVNNLYNGGGQSNQFGFVGTTGYVAAGNVSANPTFTNRTATPPDLHIAVSGAADGAGSNTYNLNALFGVANVDADGVAYANPPAAGAFEAA